MIKSLEFYIACFQRQLDELQPKTTKLYFAHRPKCIAFL